MSLSDLYGATGEAVEFFWVCKGLSCLFEPYFLDLVGVFSWNGLITVCSHFTSLTFV